ncbi:MAG: ABC transporter permease [Bacteroidota bacterium]|nr:ABC transporter permease [Bacteroidota bacterium]
MNKISLIIKREYLTRVKKKSFIIMTFIGPLLMAALFIIPIMLSQYKDEDKRTIGVIDESELYTKAFPNANNYSFVFLDSGIENAKQQLEETGFYAILHIPKTEVSMPETAVLYSLTQPTIEVKSHVRGLMKKQIEKLKLSAAGIDKETLISIQSNIKLSTIKITDAGVEENSYTEVAMGVGYALAFVIYIFIFMFGAQVMRGVLEEKTSRIVEVIISSVKPFELMMGKILGLALVGLTQILLWIVLTFGIYTTFLGVFSDQVDLRAQQEMMIQSNTGSNTVAMDNISEKLNPQISNALDIIESINFVTIIGSFLFFFLGGYLMYSALFAAIGAAVDSEADTQQFMLPITMPLILSIILASFVVQNPEGPIAFWFSIFPLTSPVIMMIRIPFGVPIFDMILSITFLIIGFLGTTWLASKIYRVGILMYGKKVDYKELWKWIRYKY